MFQNNEGRLAKEGRSLVTYDCKVDFKNWRRILGCLPLWDVGFLANVPTSSQLVTFPGMERAEIYRLAGSLNQNPKGKTTTAQDQVQPIKLQQPAALSFELTAGSAVVPLVFGEGRTGLAVAYPNNATLSKRLAVLVPSK